MPLVEFDVIPFEVNSDRSVIIVLPGLHLVPPLLGHQRKVEEARIWLIWKCLQRCARST